MLKTNIDKIVAN